MKLDTYFSAVAGPATSNRRGAAAKFGVLSAALQVRCAVALPPAQVGTHQARQYLDAPV